jgi:hypothetical protein
MLTVDEHHRLQGKAPLLFALMQRRARVGAPAPSSASRRLA